MRIYFKFITGMYYLTFYLDVKRISKEIKLHSNVILAAAMSKLLITDFLFVGLPLLYLNRFEPVRKPRCACRW